MRIRTRRTRRKIQTQKVARVMILLEAVMKKLVENMLKMRVKKMRRMKILIPQMILLQLKMKKQQHPKLLILGISTILEEEAGLMELWELSFCGLPCAIRDWFHENKRNAVTAWSFCLSIFLSVTIIDHVIDTTGNNNTQNDAATEQKSKVIVASQDSFPVFLCDLKSLSHYCC